MSGPLGFRVIRRLGPLRLEWLGSWDRPTYPQFGAWRHSQGVTLRYHAYLLRIALRERDGE